MINEPERCDKTWIATASGRKFWPLNPRAEDIEIGDIAHHLSQINRFTGACRFPYSVAQHSVIGSYHCERPLEFLLHDASEAYLNDLSRPVKHEISQYRVFEEQLERVIAAKFGLEYPWPKCVKDTDDRMLATERRRLLPRHSEDWTCVSGIEPYETPILQIEWDHVMVSFIDRFHQLYSDRCDLIRSGWVIERTLNYPEPIDRVSQRGG